MRVCDKILELKCKLEIKSHPKDWEKKGRVIVQIKDNEEKLIKEKDFVKNINSEIACDKNLTINNIANFEGNSIISNNNFLISNDQNKNIDNIKTPLRNINQNNNITNKNKTSNKKKVNRNGDSMKSFSVFYKEDCCNLRRK